MDQNKESWVNHPSLKNIDAAKLQMLMSLASQGNGKSQNELLPFLMSAATASRKNGTSFSRDETELILNVLKQGRSPEEVAKMERMVAMIKQLKPGR